MVKAASLLFTILILISAGRIYAQEERQISAKKKELSDIKDEISDLENQIRQKSAREKESYEVLENYSRQSYLLNKLINQLRTEETLKTQAIKSTQQKIKNLQNDIKGLKENYAKYIVSIYKYGSTNEIESLFDAKSIEQAILRYKYLQKFSEQREKDLTKLKQKKDELTTAKIQLEKERKEKALVASQKQEEERGLEVKLSERKKILKSIKHDKVELKKELEAKKDAETRIKDLITKLIEEAARKRAEAERLARLREKEKNNAGTFSSTNPTMDTYDVDLSTAGMSSFSALRGRMNWPVSSGRVLHKFGENRNSTLNTVTLNYGIDIKTTSNALVKAVADGVVSTINWLPGYGSVVIVTHKGDYRTVYSHLGEILVKEGERLKMGNVIGKVGESLEGNVLHFEIWNARKNQNPEIWLSRK